MTPLLRRRPPADGGGSVARLARAAGPWVGTLLVLAVIAGVIAALGGWRSAPADRGPLLAAGQVIELTRWRVEVLDAELTDVGTGGYETEDEIRLRLRLTFLGDTTELTPADDLILLLPPSGPGVPEPEEPAAFDYRYPMGFDPGIPRDGGITLSYPEGVSAPAPGTVTVIVQDERESGGFLTEGDYAVSTTVGHLELPCPDRRQYE